MEENLTTFRGLVYQLIAAMNVFLIPHGQTAFEHMRATEEEFLEICRDFHPAKISEAIKHIAADDWERSEVIGSIEGGFNGYYWKVLRPLRKEKYNR